MAVRSGMHPELTHAAEAGNGVIGITFFTVVQVRVARDQCEDGFLRLESRQMRTKAQVTTATERLVMGVFTLNVEPGRFRIDIRVMIG